MQSINNPSIHFILHFKLEQFASERFSILHTAAPSWGDEEKPATESNQWNNSSVETKTILTDNKRAPGEFQRAQLAENSPDEYCFC